MSAKKIGRPTKSKPAKNDLRTAAPEPPLMSAEEELRFSRICRQSVLDQARVDPYGDEPLSCVFAPVILKRGAEWEKDDAGKLLVGLLESYTADQIEAFFKRVVQLKRNAESLAHRNGFAYYAYSMFLEETGREPSKRELKKYIVARREVYKVQPAPGDKKGRTNLWRDSGLFTLRQG